MKKVKEEVQKAYKEMKYSVHTPERDLRSDIKIEHLRSLEMIATEAGDSVSLLRSRTIQLEALTSLVRSWNSCSILNMLFPEN
ncbi:hypothetical protein QQP08_000296 [Theobroma cacao]|nr:hypothetical protein QQP08_000296 [Theobroma cacao]